LVDRNKKDGFELQPLNVADIEDAHFLYAGARFARKAQNRGDPEIEFGAGSGLPTLSIR
jgi:hypothetical protein